MLFGNQIENKGNKLQENENKKMKNKIINKGMIEQIKPYTENNNNINAFNQADDFIKQNTDVNNCTII